jgi:REP element-mobilizing transposase RayT
LYFITICCDGMRCRFGNIENNEMILNEYGKIAYNEWIKLAERFQHFKLDVFQIMPNHMHGIIILTPTQNDSPAQNAASAPNIVRAGFTPAHNATAAQKDSPAHNATAAQKDSPAHNATAAQKNSPAHNATAAQKDSPAHNATAAQKDSPAHNGAAYFDPSAYIDSSAQIDPPAQINPPAQIDSSAQINPSAPNIVRAGFTPAQNATAAQKNSPAQNATAAQKDSPAHNGGAYFDPSAYLNPSAQINPSAHLNPPAQINPPAHINPSAPDIVRAGVNPARTISSVVGAYKSLVAKGCLEIFKSKYAAAGFAPDQIPKFGKLWHRNYYEHIIRDQRSYENIANYILNNPAKWQKDKFRQGNPAGRPKK